MCWTQAGAAAVMGIALSAGCMGPALPPAAVPEAAPSLPATQAATSPDATPPTALSEGSEPEDDEPMDGDVALEYAREPGAEGDCMDEAGFRSLSGLTRHELFVPAGAAARHLVRIAFTRAPDRRSFHEGSGGR